MHNRKMLGLAMALILIPAAASARGHGGHGGHSSKHHSGGSYEGADADADATQAEAEPAADSQPATKSPSSKYHTGKRGGCYYLTGSGKKKYVDHSFCK